MPRNITSFDWALKYTLRDKANFDVLEGLFTTILGRSVKIDNILESESNKESSEDRLIRIDLKARLGDGELALIEFQYKPEHHFFRRLLFYTSKTLVEHVKIGSQYNDLPKIYTISVCDFNLGSGDDYVYHGRQKFIGVHSKKELEFRPIDTKRLNLKLVDEIFPEYIIISLGNFPDKVHTQLDEWLYALKTGQVEEGFSAPGLDQAAERLDLLKMSREEKARYDRFSIDQRVVQNQNLAELAEAKAEAEALGLAKGKAEGLAKGKAEGLAKGLAEGKAEGLLEGKAEGLREGEATGLAKGLREGEAAGRQQRDRELILQTHQQGLSAKQISQLLRLEIALVQSILDE